MSDPIFQKLGSEGRECKQNNITAASEMPPSQQQTSPPDLNQIQLPKSEKSAELSAASSLAPLCNADSGQSTHPHGVLQENSTRTQTAKSAREKTRRNPPKALLKKKVRLSPVEAAFRALQRPRWEIKKLMSSVWPPLFADESEYGVVEKEDLEAADELSSGKIAEDSSSDSSQKRLVMWDPIKKRKVAGFAAPMRKNLDEYLAKKPFMQLYYGQDSLAERDARQAEERESGKVVASARWCDARYEVVLEPGDIPMCKVVRSGIKEK